jgi:integrase
MASRRRKGDGSIYHDAGRGRWVGEVTVNGRRHKVARKTKVDARAALVALVERARSGQLDDRAPSSVRLGAGELLVDDVLADFLERDLAGRDRAPSTVARHHWSAAHVGREIGDYPADELRVRDVDDMLDRLAESHGLARASLVKIKGTLSQALRFAVRRGDLERNVAQDATITPSAARTRPRQSLSPDDARRLLAALRNEPNGAMFALSLRLGLRPGEAAGVHWSDLHGSALNVTRAVRLTDGRAEVVDDLKVEAARRTIELPADLVDWLGEHRRWQLEQRIAAARWADDRLMFASSVGSVLSPANCRRQLLDICTRADVPAIRPNELRHSCASLLSDIGVQNEAIADLLGHTTTRMVDQTYRHRLRPIVDVAARADWTSTSG